jgi:hypothetical protein
MHLNAACSLLANLQGLAAIDGISGPLMDNHSGDPANFAMLHLVVGTLRWFDVLLSCSLQVLPSISTKLPDMLHSEKDTTQIADKITCQGLVLTTLAEVLELDHWKGTGAKEGRLSVVELVNRASNIERNITSAQNFIETTGGGKFMKSGSVTGKKLFSQVINIFIATTRVYLQVIVSGSHRQVPEIMESVTHTVSLFGDLLSTEIITHLLWPFCFIGCLATANDREVVTRLADEAVSKADCPSNVISAYTIIKECWRLLDEEALIDPDWVSAMKSLECQVIVF